MVGIDIICAAMINMMGVDTLHVRYVGSGFINPYSPQNSKNHLFSLMVASVMKSVDNM